MAKKKSCSRSERSLLNALKESQKWVAKVAADYDQGSSAHIGLFASRRHAANEALMKELKRKGCK